MTAKDVVVIADVISAPLTKAECATATAKQRDITSDMSSALKVGADDGQRTSGKRKGVANEG